jgi:hypothetical protein
MSLLSTPVRRLEGITYWVIEDSAAIHDFINTEIRREWEKDALSEHRDPKDDPWLRSLSKRRWSLEIMEMARIKLSPEIMAYVDAKSGYIFSESLAKRSRELQESINGGGLVIWPLVVKKEDTVLVDGYCRHATLKAMSVSRTYAYVGVL